MIKVVCALLFLCLPLSSFADKGKLIVLDAGHGGADHGTTVQSLLEKRLSLVTALMTRKHLAEMGYRVILTRTKDVYLSLPRRVSIANKNKGALFVSIHYNSARNPDANGIEIFYCEEAEKKERSRESRQLANCILHRVIDETGSHSRGVKKGNHHVTRESAMPAVLVEGGFLTNLEERQKLKERSYLDKIAKGIAEGIDKYLKTN